MLAVAVNGFGTIGKRVADAVRAQPDMRVTGVAKRSPDHGSVLAIDRGYPLYAPTDRIDQFRSSGLDPDGDIDAMLRACDIVVDATPGGVGVTNVDRYTEAGVPFILQGAEPHDAVDASFCAPANFDAAIDANAVRVVSCNTTGLARTFAPIEDAFGIDGSRVTLIRRGGDPSQSDRGPINDVLPDPVTIPSHHGPDLSTVLPDIEAYTMAFTVPTTLMHVHAVNVTLESDTDADTVAETLATNDRVQLLAGNRDIDGIGTIAEIGRDLGRSRGDVWETCVWADSITVVDRELFFMQAIHQESIVVPENIDAIRAMTTETEAIESMNRTNDHLGVGEWPREAATETTVATPVE